MTEAVPVFSVDQLLHNLTTKHRHNSTLLATIFSSYYYHTVAGSSSDAEHHHSADIPPAIDILTISAEGHDALAIKGAKHLLKRHAIRSVDYLPRIVLIVTHLYL